jgi:hypothetical protein
MRGDGMNVPSRTERADARATAEQHPHYAEVKKELLWLYAACFGSQAGETEEQILATDPNDFDVDPAGFYEWLPDKFGVPFDDKLDYFGGFGGTIADTIAFITLRWNGTYPEPKPSKSNYTTRRPTSRTAKKPAKKKPAKKKLAAKKVTAKKKPAKKPPTKKRR